ncbi:MAG: dihydrofolate reductase family protein [Micrococcales bacterium]|nr:dihydrofolate reductase family protein [Micrococcales bacterium]
MRLLMSEDDQRTGPVGPDRLRELYAWPAEPWVRSNMVATVDGSASGHDGVSGSINTTADNAVFDVLRSLADVVVVGAGTVRAEGYGRLERDDSGHAPTIAVVSGSGSLPRSIGSPEEDRGEAVLVTCASAPAGRLRHARGRLGADHVVVAGDDVVDLPLAFTALAERFGPALLLEGGPTLLTDALAAGLVDEMALSWTPRLVGRAHSILAAEIEEIALAPRHLLEEDGTLLGLWTVRR